MTRNHEKVGSAFPGRGRWRVFSGMSFIRDLTAVMALPVRLATVGILTAGIAGGATLLLVGTPGVAPSLSLRTSEQRAATAPATAPGPAPTPEERAQAPAPRPVAGSLPAPFVEPEDSAEAPDD